MKTDQGKLRGIFSITVLKLEMKSTKHIHWYSSTRKNLFLQITTVFSLNKVIIQFSV